MIDIRVLKNKAFKKEQLKVFLITVILYCTWHAARTAWAYSKSSVKKSDSFLTDQKLGVLDMCFMLAYASGLFFNGWLGDKSDLKSFIIIGSIISLSGYYTFALLVRNGFYSLMIFAICFLLHGFGQSRGFPGNIAILGNWVEPSKRGFLLGLWNASINIGNIMGQQIGRLTIETFEGNWTTALFIAGGTMVVMSFVLYFYLQDSPQKAGLEVSTEDPSRQEISRGEAEIMDTSVMSTSQLKNDLKFSDIWETPGLIRYCLVFACIKGATYGLLFWLPDYLQSVLHFGSSTSIITATYEFGQFLGAIGLGYYSDHLGKRSTVIVVALYISAGLFMVLAYLGVDCTVYSFGIIIFCAGIFFGGPEAIVGGVVSSDIGEGVTMNKDVRSMSTMAGVIDGSGSIGAAAIQLIIPHFKTSSFYIYFSKIDLLWSIFNMSVLCLMAALLLTPSLIADVKKKLAGEKLDSDYRSSKDIELQERGRH